jgi:hypothetical protein
MGAGTIRLADKMSDPVHGRQIEWYVRYVEFRVYAILGAVIHNEEELQEWEFEIYMGMHMEEALENGWITGYSIVKTRRAFPYGIKNVWLVLPDGVERTVWKRLLGNRAYNNLQHFSKELVRDSAQKMKPVKPLPPRDNTYYGHISLNGTGLNGPGISRDATASTRRRT